MNSTIELTFPQSLDLTTNQTTIDDTFNVAEDITGPYFNDSYSPFWTKKKDIDSKTVVDKNGSEYSITDSHLVKDDVALFPVTNKKFSREIIEKTHDLFYSENKIIYTADFDSINHNWNIEYNNTKISGPTLFSEGTIVHSRLKVIDGDFILVSLFIDDNNNYKVYIKTNTITEVVEPQWKRNTYTASGPSFTEDTTKTMYNPIIYISKIKEYFVVSICANQGQPFKTTDFSYSTYFIDDKVYSDIAFSTTSIPSIQENTQEITLTNNYTITANTYTNNPCYGYKLSGPFYSDYPKTFTPITDYSEYLDNGRPTIPLFLTYEKDGETVRDQIGLIEDGKFYAANFGETYLSDTGTVEISNLSAIDEIVFDDGYTPEFKTTIIGFTETSWNQYTYVYTDNTVTYKNSANPGTISYSKVILDLSNTNIPDGEVISITGAGEIKYNYTWNKDYPISGDGFEPSEWIVGVTYNGGSMQSTTLLPRNYNGTQIFEYTYNTSVNKTAFANPVLVDDEGFLHALVSAAQDTRYTTVGGIIPFRAIVSTITKSSTTRLTISYTTDEAFENVATYQYYKGSSFALGQNMFRQVTTFGQTTFSATVNGNKALDIVYDSGANEVFYEPGILQNNDQFYTSITQDPMPYSNVGTVVHVNDKYRLVYVNNLLVGISYGDRGYIGTELAEWNSIDTSFYVVADDDDLYYKDNDGTFYHIYIEEGNDIQLLENRYIVINSIDYFNVWDIEENKKSHYASDYAQRCIAGSVTYNANLPQVYYKKGALLSDNIYLFTSGINANYLVTANGISSVTIGPISYMRLVKGYETFISCKQPTDTDIEPIDVYYSTTGSYAQYSASYKVYNKAAIKYINGNLIGINYPIATGAYTLYSPNIFTTYLTTLANKDSVLNGKYAYQLVYANNTTPVLLFSTATQMENIETIFVIQSQFYAVANNKLYALTYSNGTLVEMDAIIDTTGLQYLGNLPTIAYFYSPMNKAFYSFTGDANLTLLYEANKINRVYSTYYNTATQALYICTDSGVYIISSNAMYRLPIYGVTNIFFTGLGYSIIETENSLIYISYYKRDGYTPLPLYLETKLYGSKGKKNISITKWHITLIQNGYTESGTITVQSKTLTDTGCISKEKKLTINPKDWDEVTKSFQFEHAAALERGQGVSLAITSMWPIANITAEVVVDNSLNTTKKII